MNLVENPSPIAVGITRRVKTVSATAAKPNRPVALAPK